VTLILRRTDAPLRLALGSAGVCRVGLCEIVGSFGTGPLLRVVFLGGWR
jgi:hypothetical protein